MCLRRYIFICIEFYTYIYCIISVWLPVWLSICLPVCLSACLSVGLITPSNSYWNYPTEVNEAMKENKIKYNDPITNSKCV